MSKKTHAHDHAGHASNAETREGPVEKPAPASQKVSEEERRRLIQVRSYDLWERAGRPHGEASRERFWCEAEKELMSSHARNE
jgi:hypothetical protein